MSNDLTHLPEQPGPDPHPNPSRFVGRPVSFDYPVGQPACKRLVGTVEAQAFIGYTQRGRIPDYQLTIRGKSGKTLTVSLVESYATFPDLP